MIQRYIYILSLLVSFSGYAQVPDKDDTETLMRRDFSFGLNFNANGGATGWGLAFEYSFQKNYKYKNTVGFTCTNIRHPKEFKIYSDISNSKGYFFGKLNSLISFRPTYGGKLIMFKAQRENGIEISFKWSIGPSFGLLKPVYLLIEKSGTAFNEKYNPSIHNIENITGRSPWVKGLGEAQFEFGAFTKFGFDFNFSTAKNKISGGEVGVMLDYFVGTPIILLHNNLGDNFFPSIYLQFNLGQKLY